jgi:hypothetical protein
MIFIVFHAACNHSNLLAKDVFPCRITENLMAFNGGADDGEISKNLQNKSYTIILGRGPYSPGPYP